MPVETQRWPLETAEALEVPPMLPRLQSLLREERETKGGEGSEKAAR